jgi:hypothetical protein
MAMVTHGPLKDVYFGFDLERLFVRVDFDQAARAALASFDALRISFAEPAGCEFRIEEPGRTGQRGKWTAAGESGASAGITFAVDRIVEVAIPFEHLGIKVGDSIQFCVELMEGRQSRDRAPREGAIALARPSADFERVMWDV